MSKEKDPEARKQKFLATVNEPPRLLLSLCRMIRQSLFATTSGFFKQFELLCKFWLVARAGGEGVGCVSILEPDTVKCALEVPDLWELTSYLCISYPGVKMIGRRLFALVGRTATHARGRSSCANCLRINSARKTHVISYSK